MGKVLDVSEVSAPHPCLEFQPVPILVGSVSPCTPTLRLQDNLSVSHVPDLH